MSVEESAMLMHSEHILPSNSAGITRLPFDILRDIFVMGWRDHAFETAAHFSLLVSSVCQWWRQIALDIPDLWTKIIVEIYLFRTYEMVATYLERSKRNPLHLRVADTYTSSDGDDNDSNTGAMPKLSIPELKALDKMLLLLNGHLSRWQTIDFVSISPSALRNAFSYMHGEASILKSFSFRMGPGTDGRTRPRFLHLESVFPYDFSAPAISSLDMTSISFRFHSSGWKQLFIPSLVGLEELIIHDNFISYLDPFLDAICLLPNLTRLVWDEVQCQAYAQLSIRHLPKLTWLSFVNIRPYDITTLLIRVDAPNLKTLYLENVIGGIELAARFFTSILAHDHVDLHFPQLYHLIINTAFTDVVALLSARFIRRLTLQFRDPPGDDGSDPAVNCLAALAQCVPDNGGWLCRNLEVLEVLAEGVRPESLRRLVESRLEASEQVFNFLELAPSAIQYLRISGPLSEPWREEDKQWLIDHVPECVFED